MSKFNEYLEATKKMKKDHDTVEAAVSNIKNSLEDAESQDVKITKKMIKDALSDWQFKDEEDRKKAFDQLVGIFI